MQDDYVLRILIHNVGHHELYLRLRSGDRAFTVRPNPHGMAVIGTELLKRCQGFENATSGGGDIILEPPLQFRTNRERARLRLGSEEEAAVRDHGAEVVAIEFQNLSAALTHWHDGADGAHHVLLVTTAPEESDIAGSATLAIAGLMAKFADYKWPGVNFEVLEPLREDPFRFSSMNGYVRSVVRKAVDDLIFREVRSGEGWNGRVELVLSASTGTTPVISALHEAFRDLTPMFLHIPRARQRPKGTELPHVESYSFREITHRVPVSTIELAEDEQLAVSHMRRWRDQFLAATDDRHELGSFWLRKGNKPVLAVLGVETKSGLVFHQACNLEVSLPTGTLCAERNAIGTALASNPALRREDIKIVAVLSLPGLNSGAHMNPLGPCGACMEWLRKVAEASPSMRILTFTDASCDHVIVERVCQ